MRLSAIVVGLVGLAAAAVPAAPNNGTEALDTPFRAMKRWGTCWTLCAAGKWFYTDWLEDYKTHGCEKTFWHSCPGEGEEKPKAG